MMLRATQKVKKLSARFRTLCTGNKAPAEKSVIPPLQGHKPKPTHYVAATGAGAAAGMVGKSTGIGSVINNDKTIASSSTDPTDPIDPTATIASSSTDPTDPIDPTACIWCKKSKEDSPDCTITKCAKSGFSSIVEACKTHLNENRFPCYECKEEVEVEPFPTVKDLLLHYEGDHPALFRFKETIACDGCRARFYTLDDLTDHLTRTDRYQCPLKKRQDQKEYKKRFLKEKKDAEKVFDYLVDNDLWEDDKPKKEELEKGKGKVEDKSKKEEPDKGKGKVKKGGKSKK